MILGLDVGYSNLKLAAGEGRQGKPELLNVLPAGAAPAEYVSSRLLGGCDGRDENLVVLDGETWVAGVDQDRIEALDRAAHADYTGSKPFRALAYLALSLAGQKQITHLVTGLPVSHYRDGDMRKRLSDMLVGEHVVRPGVKVKVEKVSVLPQPAGAYMDLLNQSHDDDVLEEGRVVVIDPGFFSLDWVIIDRGEIREQSSGSTTRAMSVLLEDLNDSLKEDLGGAPGVETLERALRQHEDSILVFGKRVPLAGHLQASSKRVAETALSAMRQAMRSDEKPVDMVVLVGGGAEAYGDAAREIFPKSLVHIPVDPVLANARGFWSFGV